MAAIFRSRVIAANRQFGGPFATPAGATQIPGIPDNLPLGGCRVLIFDQEGLSPIYEETSDSATGAYQFVNLRAGRYFVIAFSPNEEDGAVIKSDIVIPAS